MIPKIIHCCIVGRKLTDLEERCVRSWAKVLPDYTLMTWDGANGPIHSEFFREAAAMKPVNASNYLRYWALHEYGGIYLDNDMEMLRPLDLSLEAFVGFQRDDKDVDSINMAVLGARRGHPLMRRCMDRLDSFHWDAGPIWTGPGMITEELRKRGLLGLNLEQMVDDIKVYSKERFYPWRWDESPDMSRVTERTFGIHHWAKTWIP